MMKRSGGGEDVGGEKTSSFSSLRSSSKTLMKISEFGENEQRGFMQKRKATMVVDFVFLPRPLWTRFRSSPRYLATCSRYGRCSPRSVRLAETSVFQFHDHADDYVLLGVVDVFHGNHVNYRRLFESV